MKTQNKFEINEDGLELLYEELSCAGYSKEKESLASCLSLFRSDGLNEWSLRYVFDRLTETGYEGDMDFFSIIIKKAMSETKQSILNRKLLKAAAEGNAIKASKLLKSGADPNAKGDGIGKTAVYLAAEAGSVAVLSKLLEAGGDPNHGAIFGAIRGKSQECAKFLIKAGANMSVSDEKDDSPIHCACSLGSDEFVDLLLSNGFFGGSKPLRGMSAFNAALDKMTLESIGKIWNAMSLSDRREELKNSAAMWLVAGNKNAKIIEFLLQNGFNPNFVALGTSPVATAARKGNLAGTEAFLKGGANPNLENEKGEAALHAAAKYDSGSHCVSILVAYGAKLEHEDHDGTTPLEKAFSNCAEESALALLKAGAKMTASAAAAAKRNGSEIAEKWMTNETLRHSLLDVVKGRRRMKI